MKQKKLWSILVMLVLVLGTAVTISSCSKDDDDSSIPSELVGTWYYDNGHWEYTLTLNSNGTFSQDKEARSGSTGGAKGVFMVSGSTVTLKGTSWTLYSGGDFEEDDDYESSLTYSNGRLSYEGGGYSQKDKNNLTVR